jgi:hypothetical protein
VTPNAYTVERPREGRRGRELCVVPLALLTLAELEEIGRRLDEPESVERECARIRRREKRSRKDATIDDASLNEIAGAIALTLLARTPGGYLAAGVTTGKPARPW